MVLPRGGAILLTSGTNDGHKNPAEGRVFSQTSNLTDNLNVLQLGLPLGTSSDIERLLLGSREGLEASEPLISEKGRTDSSPRVWSNEAKAFSVVEPHLTVYQLPSDNCYQIKKSEAELN